VNNNMTAAPLPNDAIIGRLAHIERQLHLTRLLAAGAIGAIALVSLAAFKSSAQKTRFDEIDVERINVVERDGRVRMVIANRERSPGPLFKGKPFGYPGGTRAGLIFYDDEGTEDGVSSSAGRPRTASTRRQATSRSINMETIRSST
jgi:hypothetical protein